MTGIENVVYATGMAIGSDQSIERERIFLRAGITGTVHCLPVTMTGSEYCLETSVVQARR